MVIQLIETSRMGSTIVDLNVWIRMSERLSRAILEANSESFGQL